MFFIHSIVSHHRIPNNLFECNMYFSSKHASLALTNTVRREVGKIKAPIRVTVRYFIIFLCINYNF